MAIKKAKNIFGINFLSKTSTLFILIGIYFSLLIEAYFNILQFRNVFFLLGMFGIIPYVFITGKIKIKKDFFEYALLSIPILIVSIFFWEKKGDINVYIVLLTTIVLISFNFTFLKKMLIYLFVIIIIIALYEYISKSYFFAVKRVTIWGLKSLDESFYGGFSKIFRAKGLFEGPLALAQMSIGMALLFKNNLKIVILSLIGAFLANGRLGIIIVSLVLLLHVYSRYNLSQFLSSKRVIMLLFLILGIGIYLITKIDEKSLQRLLDIFNTKETSNYARIQYWKDAVHTFFTYDFLHMIFGNNGYYSRIYKNSAENGWLMLLVNNGIIGFIYYIFPLITIGFFSIKFKTIHLSLILLLIFAMIVQTFHLGASASLFYWLVIYSYILELKELSAHKALNNLEA